jgi:hypothetical protein
MLPETGSEEVFKDAIIAHLPIWELSDRLKHDGIVMHGFAYRPNWITIDVSWHVAHEVWGHEVPTNTIKTIISGYVRDQGFSFSHWVPKQPEVRLWIDTAYDKIREAKVYMKTVPADVLNRETESAIIQAAKHRAVKEVNANILATSFNMSEEAGLHDQD